MKPHLPPRTRRVLLLAAWTALLPLLSGCGGDEPRGPAATPDARRPAPTHGLAPVTDEARARFALDRLVKGPLPRTTAFAIPELHTLNIAHARADLAALPDETRTLLAEPRLVRALTRPERKDHNPWHNVLDTLAWLPDLPADLALAWTEPALEQVDVQLLRRTVRVLERVQDDDRVMHLLLQLVTRRPTDRDLVPRALKVLLRGGSPWRQRALGLALEEGSGVLWQRIPGMLFGQTEAFGGAADADDALAWWGLLTQGTEPQPMLSVQRTTSPTWYPARLLLDPRVWPEEPHDLARAMHNARVLAPGDVSTGGGSLPTARRSTAVLPVARLHQEGRTTGAAARCALARAGRATYVAAVRADRAGSDPALAMIARGCILDAGEASDDEARELLTQFLELLDAGFASEPAGVVAALDALFESDPAAARALARRVLEEARPVSRYGRVLEAVYDRLRTHAETDTMAWVAARAAGEDAEDAGLAVTLIRRDPDARYLPAIESRLAKAAPEEVASLRRVLIWLHGAGRGVDDASRASFARVLGGWIDEVSDAEASTLATGLLDLGRPGAEAYAAGLTGERRRVYVDGLLNRRRLVPAVVARSLLDGVDTATPPGARHRAWIAAYRTAPAEAADALAAARDRLDPDVRREVDDVLEVLRHRAPRANEEPPR